MKNEYVVVLNQDDVSKASVAAVANEHASRFRGRLLATFENGLRGYGIAMPEQAAAQLADDPRVAWIEENAVARLSYVTETFPDDRKWHLNRIDSRFKVTDPAATKQYGWTSTGTGVDVYIVDTGVQRSHSEFTTTSFEAGTSYAGGDGFTETNPCGGWISKYNGGHGTAVASLVAGKTVGVARGATIVPVKVATCNPGAYLWTTDPPTPELVINNIGVLWGLNWILGRVQDNPGRKAVVNMSFYFDDQPDSYCPEDSTHSTAWDCRTAFENNVNDLLAANVVVVASANNQNQDHCSVQSPARFGYGGMYDPNFDSNPSNDNPNWRGVITVGGTNIDDQRYTCPTCAANDRGSNYGPCVSIYAPASVIQSAHIAGSAAFRDEQTWVTQAVDSHYYPSLTLARVYSGTSFASPIVAGIAARLRETYGSKDVRQIWDYLYGASNWLSDDDPNTPLPTDFDGDVIRRNDKLAYITVFD